MAGHSKWANIRFRKERQDAKRGKIFTKLIKEITVAARMGGGDPETNPRLRNAIQAAKAANMPMKNIENAIKKGTGELPGTTLEEVTYEGYGPGGVAVFVVCTTDNRNRTVSEIRHLFSKYGGNLGESGCVAWMFDHKGLIRVPAANYDEEELMLLAIDAGADDFVQEEEYYEIYTAFEDLDKVRAKLEEAGIHIASAEETYIPQNTVSLEGKKAEQMLKLMEALEENDDVQKVYANFDIDVAVMEQISSQ
ncbi:MAG: YebC/PmpR family DNA-binding transcriptional regulator [Calditrichaeota bacterium]|nr:MAG: YebC/PmpR family DNA-binding transcriptional regulator [Calditrichota bacterium]